MNECGYVEEPIRRKNRKGNQCKKNNTITMRVAEEQWVNMQRDEAGKSKKYGKQVNDMYFHAKRTSLVKLPENKTNDIQDNTSIGTYATKEECEMSDRTSLKNKIGMLRT